MDQASREYFDLYMRKQGEYAQWELDKMWTEHLGGVEVILKMIRSAVHNPKRPPPREGTDG